MSRRRLPLLALAVATLLSTQVVSASAQPADVIPWDHYKTYLLALPITSGVPVTLTDQFGTRACVVLNLEQFALPVDKNGEGIRDSLIHLTWWRIQQDAEPTRTILVDNQFGLDQQWTVYDARYLLVPAFKNPPAGTHAPAHQHFKCYNASGPRALRDVSLSDQFSFRTAFVDTGEIFCNPVAKTLSDGSIYPILDPDVHLACYRLVPPNLYDVGFTFVDQFFSGFNIVTQELWLCVPSRKEEPTQTESATWGRIKVLYR